jgi:hypothetical protein
MKPPKYYDSQLEIEDELAYEKIKEQRRTSAMKHEKPDKYRRLEDGNKIKEKKLKNLVRNL